MSNEIKKIINRSEDFAKWYTSVVQEAKLIQYYDVKGTMIFQPYGWEIWELIKNNLDIELKKTGSKNLSMPTFIPLSDFEREKEHVEGFSPELYTITKIGNNELTEKLAIRPTSEIVFCKYWKKILTSYKELPFKHNQWSNVFRAEKTTKPFLRNSEFYWQELHGLFDNENDAINYALEIQKLYSNFINNVLCIPNITGEKTPGERFAGAEKTFTIETIMQDNQALQSATSHYLGQNFTKAYEISFQNKENKIDIPYSTSHGLSTRIIGAIIMVHGDDNGLVLPFKIAPIQIAILPLFISKNPEVLKFSKNIQDSLKEYRTYLDESNKSIGFMISEYQVQGVPFQIVIGPNDLANKTLTIFRRDLNIKETINISDLNKYLSSEINTYNNNLFNKAKKYLDNAIVDVKTFDEFKENIKNNKWVRCHFDGSIEDEKKIKELTGATPRCVVENAKHEKNCIITGKKTKNLVIFARAY
ncbi:MAG: proline--tRNA ligase [Ureaplasma sp.]|nr:proline--tRNA ligase [Ureaplasma sp.]